MPKITRDRLARGTRLTREAVFTPISDAAGEFNEDITAEQMAKPEAPWRLNLWTAGLDGTLFLNTGTTGRRGHYMIPFTLPPLQQNFDTTAQVAATTPVVTLDEVQLSFDQRGEPAAIHSLKTANERKINFDDAGLVYDMQLRIMEKRMVIFDSAAPAVPEREIASWDIPAALLTAPRNRQNPLLLKDLGLTLSPYRTYVIYLRAEGLHLASGEVYMLPSLHIGLRGRTTIGLRENVATDAVQNIPTKHNGARTGVTVSITTPASGTAIEADTADGVGTALELVEAEHMKRLRGGYGEYSDVPATEHLEDDSAYEIIAVNLFGMSQQIDPSNPTRLPYVGATPYKGITCDRRIIPIKYPLTIHHVIAVQSYLGTPATTTQKPNKAAFDSGVGVAIGSGWRADKYDYQQVAYATWDETDASRALILIDRIKERTDGDMNHATGSAVDYDMAMYNIPLVHEAAGALGTSYTVPSAGTGPPIFMGKSTNDTSTRTNIAPSVNGAAPGASAVAGQDQWIEVRWTFGETTNGLAHAASYPTGTIFVGHGGHWVYLVCSKPLVAPGRLGVI